MKLLAKLYEPASGAILIDDAPLVAHASPPTGEGASPARCRTSSASSSRARQTIGLGDVDRMEDEPAVMAAAARAGADDVVARLPSGLDTQLGRTWPGGAEPSFGQWQKLSLARGFMREAPLVQVLDEPTAALDAETEHALFERYAAAARAEGDANGRITIFVSHRFSTVRMADLIIVLDGARLGGSGLARGADGPPRTLFGALRHPGGRLPAQPGVSLACAGVSPTARAGVGDEDAPRWTIAGDHIPQQP